MTRRRAASFTTSTTSTTSSKAGSRCPPDPEYFCAGCNLQLLYVLWYARHHVTLTE